MNKAIALKPSHRVDAAPVRAPRVARIVRDEAPALAPSVVEGPFSLFADRPLSIAAEAGLVIRVDAGCLWVPDAQEQCSVAVGEGESFVVRHAGPLTVHGGRGTQVELVWPGARHAAALH
jgi:hypothetical protein